MNKDDTKLTNAQIIGVVALLIILVIIFSKVPATEQATNLQEQSTKEFIELPTSSTITSPVKTSDSLTSEDKLRVQIRKHFTLYVYREWNRPARDSEKDVFDSIVAEIKIQDGTYGKNILVKYNSGARIFSLFNSFDEVGILYKAIFTYGEKVQKAVIEHYLPDFQDRYGNKCKVFAWSSKIDSPTIITKVNWEDIPAQSVEPWWEEIYLVDLEATNCK